MSSSNRQGNLRLSLVDVLGKNIGGKVDVKMIHQVLSHRPVFNGLDASKRIPLTDLFGAPQGNYRIEIDPSAYLGTSRFVNINASGMTDLKVTCAIDPSKVSSITFPAFSELPADTQRLLENSSQVLGLAGKKGQELYAALDDVRKANVLNLTLKSAMTPLSNGRTVLSFLEAIKEIRGDRFFVVAPRELRQETKHSAVAGLFNPAPDVKHNPPPGFERAGSFKTPDKFGNLQLTFFLKGDECEIDIDIDPVSGLEHLLQVIEHDITHIQTHPYAVREVLIAHQQIDPEYRFVV
jgi:hypothetical protein